MTLPTPEQLLPVMQAASGKDTIDDSCRVLQDFLGVTDGGIAGIHFSDIDDGHWATMNTHLRLKRLREYVNTEISYIEDEPRGQILR